MFLVRSSFFSLCEMWTFFEVVLILETRAHDSELLLICLSDLWMSCDSDKGVDQSTLCVVGCSVCVCVALLVLRMANTDRSGIKRSRGESQGKSFLVGRHASRGLLWPHEKSVALFPPAADKTKTPKTKKKQKKNKSKNNTKESESSSAPASSLET